MGFTLDIYHNVNKFKLCIYIYLLMLFIYINTIRNTFSNKIKLSVYQLLFIKQYKN